MGSSSLSTGTETVIYNYVNPEDCQCECHEVDTKAPPLVVPTEEIEPLLQQDEDSSDETMKPSTSKKKNHR